MLKRARDILCVDIQRDAATTVDDFSEEIVASLHESDTWCHDTELNDFTVIVSIFLQLILSLYKNIDYFFNQPHAIVNGNKHYCQWDISEQIILLPWGTHKQHNCAE